MRTFKNIKAWAKTMKINVEEITSSMGRYEAYHEDNHSETAVCMTLNDVISDVWDLAEKNGTLPIMETEEKEMF